MAIQAHHISNSSGFVFGGCQDENAYGLNNLRCYNDHRLSIPHIVSAQFETQRFEIHHYLNTQVNQINHFLLSIQGQTNCSLQFPSIETERGIANGAAGADGAPAEELRIQDSVSAEAERRRDLESGEEENGAGGVREEDGDGEGDVAAIGAGGRGDGGVAEGADEGGGVVLRREREGTEEDGLQMLQF